MSRSRARKAASLRRLVAGCVTCMKTPVCIPSRVALAPRDSFAFSRGAYATPLDSTQVAHLAHQPFEAEQTDDNRQHPPARPQQVLRRRRVFDLGGARRDLVGQFVK